MSFDTQRILVNKLNNNNDSIEIKQCQKTKKVKKKFMKPIIPNNEIIFMSLLILSL